MGCGGRKSLEKVGKSRLRGAVRLVALQVARHEVKTDRHSRQGGASQAVRVVGALRLSEALDSSEAGSRRSPCLQRRLRRLVHARVFLP